MNKEEKSVQICEDLSRLLNLPLTLEKDNDIASYLRLDGNNVFLLKADLNGIQVYRVTNDTSIIPIDHMFHLYEDDELDDVSLYFDSENFHKDDYANEVLRSIHKYKPELECFKTFMCNKYVYHIGEKRDKFDSECSFEELISDKLTFDYRSCIERFMKGLFKEYRFVKDNDESVQYETNVFRIAYRKGYDYITILLRDPDYSLFGYNRTSCSISVMDIRRTQNIIKEFSKMKFVYDEEFVEELEREVLFGVSRNNTTVRINAKSLTVKINLDTKTAKLNKLK